MSKPASQEKLIAALLGSLPSSVIQRVPFGYIVMRQDVVEGSQDHVPQRRRKRRTKAEMQDARELVPAR